MRAAIDGINAFQLLLAAATSIPLAFHPPSNVFGRFVDDSCSTPLALGSLWAFVCAVLLCGIIAARVLDEERFLSRILPV
jgi:protein-S-isoprenylcysteine O-methyltransferase Ste14